VFDGSSNGATKLNDSVLLLPIAHPDSLHQIPIRAVGTPVGVKWGSLQPKYGPGRGSCSKKRLIRQQVRKMSHDLNELVVILQDSIQTSRKRF
jgi:hypothetical protein